MSVAPCLVLCRGPEVVHHAVLIGEVKERLLRVLAAVAMILTLASVQPEVRLSFSRDTACPGRNTQLPPRDRMGP